jgi:hypothetical protein
MCFQSQNSAKEKLKEILSSTVTVILSDSEESLSEMGILRLRLRMTAMIKRISSILRGSAQEQGRAYWFCGL